MVSQRLENEYLRLCTERSDINEHLPLLRLVAEGCRHVTEFGMRGGVSTVALLAAGPGAVVSYDIDPGCKATADRLAGMLTNGTRLEFVNADTTKATIEPTEFLFIDGRHTAENVAAELANNADRVKKYIGFHDTATFGLHGEDGKAPGILAPIMALVRAGGWEVVERRQNNNGIMILKRKGDA